MKRIVYIVLLIGLYSCYNEGKETGDEVLLKGEAQGTTYTIKYIAEEEAGVKEEMDSLLKAIDLSMSTYEPSSVISHLNHGDTVTIDTMFQAMYVLSRNLSVATRGAFNPTIGPLIKAWGFDFSDPQKMDSNTVKELLLSSGFSKFQFQEGRMWKVDEKARINFNAVAQGYSVDLMASILEDKGIENYYVELGGELKVKGRNKNDEWWVIGIDQPKDNNEDRELAARISLENAAMATSGNYRKFYEIDGKRYSHTLNPGTGYPVENNLLSATVVSSNCALSDALATAFMVMGVEEIEKFLEKRQDIQVHLILAKEDGGFDTYTSESLKEKFLED